MPNRTQDSIVNPPRAAVTPITTGRAPGTAPTTVAQGVRREAETVMKAQMERFLRDMDLVKREEFEAVKDLAAKAREENEALAARIALLEEKLAAGRTTADQSLD